MTSLLSGIIETRGSSKTTGGGFLNASDIAADQPTRITILGDKSVTGYEVWGTGEGGKRVSMKFRTEPAKEDIQARAEELEVTLKGDEKARGFYGFAVWNYDLERVQIFQFSQASIIDPIINSLSDEEIQAEPHAYDFKVTTNGMTGMDKRYNVQCVPGKRRQPKIEKQISEAWDKVVEEGFDMTVLFVGGDPYKGLGF